MPDATVPKDPAKPASLTASLAAFRRSQTFLAQLPDPRVYRLRLFTVSSVLALFFLVIPLLALTNVVPAYRINDLGRYLSWALVAVGIDLIWGFTGILSLCQGFFFCLGAYAMSMHLSLPEGGGYYKVPQFMEFAYYGHGNPLPPFWRPFHSFSFALAAGVVLPVIAASIFGFFVFRSRVRGVYFSIVTQATAWGTCLLVTRNEMLLGGTNGLTNFYRPLNQTKPWILGLYLTTLFFLTMAYLLCRAISRSKLGRVLVAIRDKETRLYFAGYQPYTFKVFAFAVAAALAGIGGMLYAPQMGIVTPQNMNVEASIDMVIWVALGGRGKLWGAIFGTLLVNFTKSAITSDIPTVWLYIQGGIFLGVVLAFPDGIVGVWDSMEKSLKRGDNKSFAMMAAILGSVVLFILSQALGLQPEFLRKPMGKFGFLGTIPPKYFLILVMVIWGTIHFKWKRAPAAGAPAGGQP